MLTPNDFVGSLAEAEERRLQFQEHPVTPFQWQFTRHDRLALLARLEGQGAWLPLGA